MADFDFNKEYGDVELTDEDLGKIRGLTITFTEEEGKVVRQAIDKAKQVAQDETLSDGRSVELVCADYLAGK